jgi:hypothetical protein
VTKRRRKARRRVRRALSLTTWRAIIVGQARRDLAKHGRLQALAALVLSEQAEIRDLEIFSLLAPGGLAPRMASSHAIPAPGLWEMVREIYER